MISVSLGNAEKVEIWIGFLTVFSGFVWLKKTVMAEEVAQPLTYVPEIILKKRKSNEELALRRKEQLEQRKFQLKKNKQEYIKKPEDFVKEFRYRVWFSSFSYLFVNNIVAFILFLYWLC